MALAPGDLDHRGFAAGRGRDVGEHRQPVVFHRKRHAAFLKVQQHAGGNRPGVLLDPHERSAGRDGHPLLQRLSEHSGGRLLRTRRKRPVRDQPQLDHSDDGHQTDREPAQD